MNGEWWVILNDSAYAMLIEQGYREHTRQRRRGELWVLMLPPSGKGD